jgi:hypothetical protein
MSSAGLTQEAQAFAQQYRHAELSPEGQAFRDHLARMKSDHDYATKLRELRKDCEKCDMEIAAKLSKCNGSGCSVMGGNKRSKTKTRSKKSRSRRTTSHRRRSRARR